MVSWYEIKKNRRFIPLYKKTASDNGPKTEGRVPPNIYSSTDSGERLDVAGK